MKIEQRPIDTIEPYSQNPRINDPAVDSVAASIREFGWRQPIVIDEHNVIVVGHTRYKAARKLGLETVPVHVAKDLTPEQAKAYRIADNKSADHATWDMELLPLEIRGLQDLDFDISLLGFGEDELTEMLAPPEVVGLTDPDEVPEPPDEPVTQTGDLWTLGSHRLLCGDSASESDLDRLLDGAKVHLVNTDPPYNVAVEPRSNNAIAAGNSSFPSGKRMHLGAFDEARQGKRKATTKKLRAKDRPLSNDAVSDDEFDDMLRAWFGQVSRVLTRGRAFYIWGGYANWSNYCRILKEVGLRFAQGITWVKNHPVLGRKDYMNDCEFCWYGWKPGAAHRFFGPNNVSNVWAVKKVNPASMVHLTEKPVELAARAIQYSSKPGESVLDLFGGSGSTLIACEQHGRKAFLMELDPLYCDVIVQRWQGFTGGKAKRARRRSRKPQRKEEHTQ